MLPATIDYILSLRDGSGGQVASLAQFQVIITPVPALTTITYSVNTPSPEIKAYILYELVFGEGMVPHAFDVKIRHGADSILDVIVSGRFMEPFTTLAFIGHRQPGLNIIATNLRNLANYYELTTSYVSINGQDNYGIVVDALRRMHTSTLSEQVAQETKNILGKMVTGRGGER